MKRKYKRYATKYCEDCNGTIKRVYKRKNRILCFACYHKYYHQIATTKQGSIRISKEEALNRIYTIRGYKCMNKTNFQGQLYIPKILIGRKVKLVEVE